MKLLLCALFTAMITPLLSADSITSKGWTLQSPLPPGIARLETGNDPVGDDLVTAMNDSGVVVGASSAAEEGNCACYATIWFVTSGSDQISGENIDLANYAGVGYTRALDVTDSGLVLFWFQVPATLDPMDHYETYNLNTDVWSAPGISPAALGWTHTPRLTNDKGWTVEYGTVFDTDGTILGREAFLVETPEPGALTLLALSVVALPFLRLRSPATR